MSFRFAGPGELACMRLTRPPSFLNPSPATPCRLSRLFMKFSLNQTFRLVCVDNQRRLQGIVTLSDLLTFFLRNEDGVNGAGCGAGGAVVATAAAGTTVQGATVRDTMIGGQAATPAKQSMDVDPAIALAAAGISPAAQSRMLHMQQLLQQRTGQPE